MSASCRPGGTASASLAHVTPSRFGSALAVTRVHTMAEVGVTSPILKPLPSAAALTVPASAANRPAIAVPRMKRFVMGYRERLDAGCGNPTGFGAHQQAEMTCDGVQENVGRTRGDVARA